MPSPAMNADPQFLPLIWHITATMTRFGPLPSKVPWEELVLPTHEGSDGTKQSPSIDLPAAFRI